MCIKALYNYIGNRIEMPYQMLDRYLKKSIKLKCPEKVLDVDGDS